LRSAHVDNGDDAIVDDDAVDVVVAGGVEVVGVVVMVFLCLVDNSPSVDQ
jgi:hypothetical protein